MRITVQTWATFPLSASVFFFPLSVNVLCRARLFVHTQTHCEVHWSDCLSVSQPSVHLSPVSPSAPLYCVARVRFAQHSAMPSTKWLWLLRSPAPPSSSSSLSFPSFPSASPTHLTLRCQICLWNINRSLSTSSLHFFLASSYLCHPLIHQRYLQLISQTSGKSHTCHFVLFFCQHVSLSLILALCCLGHSFPFAFPPAFHSFTLLHNS